MTNAIASDLATVDLNGNGVVERLYASDVGGQIIRIDINEKDGTISGGVIADINAGMNAKAHRKFFTAPQIGYYAKAGTHFLALLIGTGDIANPLNKLAAAERDRFYMIKDTYIWSTPDWNTYKAADDDDFLNASAGIVYGLDSTKKGWYMDYSSDTEKSFSKAILYDYAIFFTTYSGDIELTENLCEAVGKLGTGRIYGLNLLTASAAINWSGSTEGTISDDKRSKKLAIQGIPPQPALLFPQGTGGDNSNGVPPIGDSIILFSDLEDQFKWKDRFRPIYWEEVIDE
jgi:type IV pilus assembly protein PilY1